MSVLSGVPVVSESATLGTLAVALVAALAASTRSSGPPGGGETPTRERARTVGLVTVFAVVGLLAIYLWAGILASIVQGVVGEMTTFQETAVLQASSGLGAATGIVLYLDYTDRDRSFLDVDWPTRRDVGYGAAGLVFLFGTFIAVTLLMTVLGVESAAHGTEDTIADAENPTAVALLFMITSVVIIGPGEELLYRNVVQKSLYDAFSRPRAVVVGSVIFAAVHFQAYSTGSPTQVLTSLAVVFALSLTLGAVYERTDNVVIPAAVHGLFNAVQFGLIAASNSNALSGIAALPAV
jgi:Predicted metal-dependent membrane protease